MFSESIIEETVEVDIFGVKADVDIRLTESGSIEATLPEMVQVDGPIENDLYDFEGKKNSNTQVELLKCSVSESGRFVAGEPSKFYASSISPSEIIIDSSGGNAIVNEEVTVEIDVLCFLPSNPFIDSVEELPLLERDDWSIYGESLDDRETRVGLIKEFKRPLRTATIEVRQEVNGPPSRQVEKALEQIQEVVELTSFIQGVEPTPFRARVTAVDGDEYSERYEEWFTKYRRSIGCAFTDSNFIYADLRDYLDEAYDDYLDNREPYRLHMVISWYLDALNATRTLDTKMASICSGTELFAKRHSDHGPGYYKTRNRIGYLVNKLCVETEDLAEFSGTYDTSYSQASDGNNNTVGVWSKCVQKLFSILNLDSDEEEVNYTHEYFYSYSRQYVIHGDNLKITNDELYRDYEATLTLFQRLIRNQLLDIENLENYNKLSNLNPEDSRV
ncbi:hypothetical protein [Natrinema versiforme]|uniref:ApeA N-terminal domain-containing protein n=1 Tax=Natrinema versiforme TaxID=88724 RepID=A0A4P8WP76_9EURY|nr:hypothetical protein [Natrinema versiforme]QCS43901.1 hypothetical protein FEJ81_16675 [Natrinema versiforme]